MISGLNLYHAIVQLKHVVLGAGNVTLTIIILVITGLYVLKKLQGLRNYYRKDKFTNEKSLFASLADVHPFS